MKHNKRVCLYQKKSHGNFVAMAEKEFLVDMATHMYNQKSLIDV